MSLYSKIERHYLAKLPDGDDAIITDTHKVINTLNSLCVEMDTRYDLLKSAFCKNLKEYNKKFTERKLNPEDVYKRQILQGSHSEAWAALLRMQSNFQQHILPFRLVLPLLMNQYAVKRRHWEASKVGCVATSAQGWLHPARLPRFSFR